MSVRARGRDRQEQGRKQQGRAPRKVTTFSTTADEQVEPTGRLKRDAEKHHSGIAKNLLPAARCSMPQAHVEWVQTLGGHAQIKNVTSRYMGR